MTRKIMDELLAQAQQVLPDNVAELIKPTDIRNMIKDILDTITPSYGGMRISSLVQNLTATPTALVFQSEIVAFPPEWVINLAPGTMQRIQPTPPRVNSRFTINGDIIGGQGNEVTVELYANGLFSGWRSIVTTQGASNRGTFSFSAIDVIDSATVYELRVSTNASGSYTFQNVLFVGENIPVRSLPNMALLDPKIPRVV